MDQSWSNELWQEERAEALEECIDDLRDIEEYLKQKEAAAESDEERTKETVHEDRPFGYDANSEDFRGDTADEVEGDFEVNNQIIKEEITDEVEEEDANSINGTDSIFSSESRGSSRLTTSSFATTISQSSEVSEFNDPPIPALLSTIDHAPEIIYPMEILRAAFKELGPEWTWATFNKIVDLLGVRDNLSLSFIWEMLLLTMCDCAPGGRRDRCAGCRREICQVRPIILAFYSFFQERGLS